jgi:sorbitol-specific phosphotransferase system component IIBC
MKTATFCLLLLITSSTAIGQERNMQKIENLQKKVASLENEIKIKTDSLDSIKRKIKHLQNQEYLSKFKSEGDELIMLASLKIEGKLRESRSPMSNIITTVSKNDTIRLTDYQNGYWIANKDQYFGYLSEIYINETEEIQVFKEEIIRLNEEFRSKKEKEEEAKMLLENEKQTALQKQKEKEYRQKIINQFGNETGQKLLNRYYWIGMTDKMAKISLGAPRSINRTVGAWGVHEQWVYYNMYLYFEDGILTSYQNQR